MKNEIHAFDPDRRNNAQLMVDVHQLGYLPEPVLDLTYNEGKFWNNYRPDDLTTNDLDSRYDTDLSVDFTDTGLTDASWPTVVFDPPYRLGGTPTTPHFEEQYGIRVARSIAETRALIEDGTREAVRISSRFVLVKVQDHVSSGRLQPLTIWVENAAAHGARIVDKLHVVAGRSQPKGTRQVRARHGYSTLLVFEVTRCRG